MSGKKPVLVHMDEQTKEQLVRLAEAQGASMSYVVRRLINKAAAQLKG